MSARYYCDRCGERIERQDRIITIEWTGPDRPSLSCFARPGEMDRGTLERGCLVVCQPCNEAIARALSNIMRPVEPRED